MSIQLCLPDLSDKIVGRYISSHDIVVSTVWTGEGFETFVKHPNLTYGETHIMEGYGVDREKARGGFYKWVEIAKTLKKVMKIATNDKPLETPKPIKISFLALMNVIFKYCEFGPRRLRSKMLDNSPTQILLDINDGPYKGFVMYDFIKREICGASQNWHKAILRFGHASKIASGAAKVERLQVYQIKQKHTELETIFDPVG